MFFTSILIYIGDNSRCTHTREASVAFRFVALTGMVQGLSTGTTSRGGAAHTSTTRPNTISMYHVRVAVILIPRDVIEFELCPLLGPAFCDAPN